MPDFEQTVIDEASDEDLIKELRYRGYEIQETNAEGDDPIIAGLRVALGTRNPTKIINAATELVYQRTGAVYKVNAA